MATLEQALALHQAGRLDEAEAIYARLIAADPNAIDALNLSGQIDLAYRRFDAARAKFVRARSLAPGFADAWMNEGNALRGAGRPVEALAALEQAATLAPGHALILCNRGLAKLDLGDADGAVADIAAADAAMPGVKALRENLSPSFGKSLVFVSITLDPETYTPQMLRRYAHIYGAGEQEKRLSDWLFLTGKPEDIEALRRSLGFFDLNRRVDADVTQHAALLLFGNPAKDRWAALPSSLRIPLLVETIRRFCGFSFEQRYGIPG